MKKLDLNSSIKTISDAMTDEQKEKWKDLNGSELSSALTDADKVSLLASLLEVML